MKKIISIILCAFMLLQSLPMQVKAQETIELNYFMRTGVRLRNTSYIFFEYSDSVFRYDLKTNSLIENSNGLHNVNRTGSVLTDDVYYVGTNYGYVGEDQYQFNIVGFDVNTLSVVYDKDFNFYQKTGQKFAVDKYHNFYFANGNQIISYDKNGNQIDSISTTNPAEIKQMIIDEDILVLDDGYEGKEGSVKVNNGYFESTPRFSYGKLDSYYKLSNDNQYSIDQYGQVSLMSYKDDYGPDFYSYTLYDVDTSGYSYSMSGDFNNTSAYIGDKNGNLYNLDLNTYRVVCEKNIGNKNIVNVYYLDSKIYVCYVGNGTYQMEVYDQSFLEEYYVPKDIYYNEHTTYSHTIDEIRNKYFSLMNKVDYENFDIYEEKPNLENPYYEGIVKEEVIQDLYNQVNFFRWLAGVDEVELYVEGLPTYQKAAVIQYAINRDGLVDPNGIPLDHFPSQPNDMDDAFYNVAYVASSKANLTTELPSNAILSYIKDHPNTLFDSNPIGHRTSILNYRAFRTSFGQIIGNDGIYYNATHMTRDDNKVSNDKFTAYPVAGYMPTELINPEIYWSITFTQDDANYLPDLGSKIILVHDNVEYEAIDVINQEKMSFCFKLPEELLKKITKKNANLDIEFIAGETVTVKAQNIFNEKMDKVNVTYSTTFMNLYDIYPDSIELNNSYVQLQPNESYQYKVSFNPMTTTHDQIIWSSSDSSIASIDSKGLVKAHKPGTVTITAESENGLIATSTLKVSINLQKIELEDITINRNQTVQMNIKVVPEGAELNGPRVWYTSNPDVVKINMYGEVTGLKPGTSTIRVTINGIEASCTVTVVGGQTEIPVTSVKLNKTTLYLEIGDQTTLTATINPTDATNKKLTWVSNNPNVVTVDQNGNITAVGEGSTYITATSVNGITATCLIDVYKPNKPTEITSVSLNKTNDTLTIGNSTTLIATIMPSNTTSEKTLIWTSSNSNVASVDSNGKVIAKAQGSAIITVKTVNGKTATCTINVVKAEKPITSVTLNKTSIELEKGNTCQLNATINPTETTDYKGLTWTSSNMNIASVNTNGLISANGKGTATITVKTSNGITATCTVTVKETKSEETGVDRIFGSTRYQTAMEVANALKEELGVSKFETVIIATGIDYPDALAGSYLAGKKNAPILMVNERYMDDVANYVRNNVVAGGKVYILGGDKAVSPVLETKLSGYSIQRLAGANRFETNLMILEEAKVTNEDILICTGYDFADSLSASATERPILLVHPKSGLNAKQIEFLNNVRGNKMYVIGGVNAVNDNIFNTVSSYAGTIKRIGGLDRNETSVLIAKEFFNYPTSAVVAYSRGFADGLVGGPLAIAKKAPLILTQPNKTSYAKDYITSNNIKSGNVLGGTILLSDNDVNDIFK